MKIFIWVNIENVSSRWHSSGGLIIVADSESRAREKASKYIDEYSFGNKPTIKLREDEAPDYIFNIDAKEELIFPFPDAGCC